MFALFASRQPSLYIYPAAIRARSPPPPTAYLRARSTTWIDSSASKSHRSPDADSKWPPNPVAQSVQGDDVSHTPNEQDNQSPQDIPVDKQIELAKLKNSRTRAQAASPENSSWPGSYGSIPKNLNA